MQEFWCQQCQKAFCVDKPPGKTVSCPLCKLEVNSKSERVPYQEIKNLWNDNCTSFPKVFSVTDKRKVSLRCRWQQLKKLQLFKEAFLKLEASDFCKGINIRGWKASFDWIIANDTNIIKVLEGKYDNKTTKSPKSNRGEFDEVRNLDDLVE